MMSAISSIDKGNWPVSEKDRAAIADFVGLQLVRGTRHRDALTMGIEDVGRMFSRMMGESESMLRNGFIATQGREPTPKELADIKRVALTADIKADIPRNFSIPIMLEHAGIQAQVAHDKALHLLECDEDVFVTSDSPVTLAQRNAYLGGASLAMSDQAFLPLDPRQLLVMTPPTDEDDRGKEVRNKIDRETAMNVNQGTVASAHRFVYCRPDMKSIVLEILDRSDSSS